MSARGFAILLLLAVSALTGCGMLAGRPQPVSHHVLTIPTAGAVAPAATGSNAVLLLRDTETPGVFQSVRLVYSRAPGTLSYYQYARWSETPARSLNIQLRQRLDASGLYAAVAPPGAGVRADYQLNTRLQDFYHDAAHAAARVTLEAELVSRSDARLIARQTFNATAPVTSPDAAGAAAGLGLASGRLLDEVIAWLTRVRPADAR